MLMVYASRITGPLDGTEINEEVSGYETVIVINEQLPTKIIRLAEMQEDGDLFVSPMYKVLKSKALSKGTLSNKKQTNK